MAFFFGREFEPIFRVFNDTPVAAPGRRGGRYGGRPTHGPSANHYQGPFGPFGAALEAAAAAVAAAEADAEHGRSNHHRGRGRGSFVAPKFDMFETDKDYVIQGEVPGVALEDLKIEWNNDALTISGRTFTETRREGGSGDNEQQGASAGTTEADAEAEKQPAPATPKGKASVEDADADDAGEKAVATTDKEAAVAAAAPGGNRYWVSERSFGSFSRSFSFPGTVDQDNISAALTNGVLDVHVPKTDAPAPRRIQIRSD